MVELKNPKYKEVLGTAKGKRQTTHKGKQLDNNWFFNTKVETKRKQISILIMLRENNYELRIL